jgi:hypothetical protein
MVTVFANYALHVVSPKLRAAESGQFFHSLNGRMMQGKSK